MKLFTILNSKDLWSPGLVTIIWGWNQPEYKFLLKIKIYSPFKRLGKYLNMRTNIVETTKGRAVVGFMAYKTITDSQFSFHKTFTNLQTTDLF